MTDLPAPVPAATLVLMRSARSGPAELLMMERPANMAFAAGALVFPGGRIDPGDQEAAAELGASYQDAAARIAAIRETIEETGVAPALSPPPNPEIAAQLRTGIADGTPFERLLARHGLTLDLAALTIFARWCPNFRESRSFDTIFFLAEAPPETAHAAPQEGEAVRLLWATAAQIIEEIDAGRAEAIFPTRRNLERLATFASFEEAVADAARYPVRTITPWVEQREGVDWICIPEDAGYPITAEPLATTRRG